MRKPELLAPVGTMESLYAAVQNGCDAVYLGGQAFSARAHANNLTIEEIKEALDYAHMYGVKIYVTVNTLYKDDELTSLMKFIEKLYNLNVDAIILQDFGAVELIRKAFPHLELHASTQMTIHNLEGARYLKEMGFERVVVARELTLAEIGSIIDKSGIEVESFIHGALCISYSGQCLMSSLIGGRSGNRGRCAQPCRLPYQLINGKQDERLNPVGEDYLLSPRDICALDILPQLIERGIHSFKIEGRMKRPEYAAIVSRIYRKYIDLAHYDPANYQVDPDDYKKLLQIFNRGDFSQGYYQGKQGKEMMSYRRPKNWGLKIGEVISYDYHSNTCQIKLVEEIEDGDGIEIWTSHGKNTGMAIHSPQIKNKILTIHIKGNIEKGDPVYRTSAKNLLSDLKQSYQGYNRKIELYGQINLEIGNKMKFNLWDNDGGYVQVESDERVEKARKHPLEADQVREQIGKLGNTPFELVNLEIEIDKNIFVPISRLNALRRQAVERLIEERLTIFSKDYPVKQFNLEELLNFKEEGKATKKELALYLKGDNYNPINFIKKEIDRLYLDYWRYTDEFLAQLSELKQEYQFKIFGVLPRISRDREMKKIKKELIRLDKSHLDGYLIGNLGQLELMQKMDKPFITDFSLNTFNSATFHFWREAGAEGITLSPELNLEEIRQLRNIKGAELLVYGYLPAMISTYCPGNVVKGAKNCKVNNYYLKDRTGAKFPVLNDCSKCRSEILNSRPLYLIPQMRDIYQSDVEVYRLDMTIETEEEALELVEIYRHSIMSPSNITPLMKKITSKMQRDGFTKGHFYRGVK